MYQAKASMVIPLLSIIINKGKSYNIASPYQCKTLRSNTLSNQFSATLSKLE